MKTFLLFFSIITILNADVGIAGLPDMEARFESALKTGNKLKIRAAKDEIIGMISKPDKAANQALSLVAKHNISEALPQIEQALLDNVGVVGGGGAEMQALRQSYIECLWKTFVWLTKKKSNLSAEHVPNRSELEAIIERVKKSEKE